MALDARHHMFFCRCVSLCTVRRCVLELLPCVGVMAAVIQPVCRLLAHAQLRFARVAQVADITHIDPVGGGGVTGRNLSYTCQIAERAGRRTGQVGIAHTRPVRVRPGTHMRYLTG